MKEEIEIFKEWYELNFKELPDPIEYLLFRDTLGFQRYLLWYRYEELVESIRVGSIRGKLWNVFRKLISKGRK